MRDTLRASRRTVLIATVIVLVMAAIVVAQLTRHRPGLALCGKQHAVIAGGAYIVQNDEWNSAAPECVSYSKATPAFAVASTSISQPAGSGPGGFPSLSAGCFYGQCTRGSGLPRQVNGVWPGSLTSDWVTTQPATGSYDVAYDIWFSTGPDTGGWPDAAEMMIWISHQGPQQPLGNPQDTATVAGRAATIWYGYPASGSIGTLTYELWRPVSSVQALDIGAYVRDAMRRGYLRPHWYLIDVQAGFELWQGGQGLSTNQFSVSIRGKSLNSPVALPPGWVAAPRPLAGTRE